MDIPHTQLKAKCLECGLHFIVCTERPETHSAKTLYCPECGQRNGQYLTYTEAIQESIWKHVPGKAKLTSGMPFGEPTPLPLSSLKKGGPKRVN